MKCNDLTKISRKRLRKHDAEREDFTEWWRWSSPCDDWWNSSKCLKKSLKSKLLPGPRPLPSFENRPSSPNVSYFLRFSSSDNTSYTVKHEPSVNAQLTQTWNIPEKRGTRARTLSNFSERLFGILSLILVRMIFDGQFSEGFFDFLRFSVSLHTEYLIIVFVESIACRQCDVHHGIQSAADEDVDKLHGEGCK